MRGEIMGKGYRVLTGLVSLYFLLLSAGGAWSEEPRAGGSCVARVDVYQVGSKKTSFSKMFSYKARVRPNTRECSVVDWQLSWDYHRKDTGKLEKDAMLLATTVERGEGNATEEGEVQEDTNDTELNFRAENVTCRLCEEAATRKKQEQPSRESSGEKVEEKSGPHYKDGRLCGVTKTSWQQDCPISFCICNDGNNYPSKAIRRHEGELCCLTSAEACEDMCNDESPLPLPPGIDPEQVGKPIPKNGWSGKFGKPIPGFN
jgi:hypothetical protein